MQLCELPSWATAEMREMPTSEALSSEGEVIGKELEGSKILEGKLTTPRQFHNQGDVGQLREKAYSCTYSPPEKGAPKDEVMQLAERKIQERPEKKPSHREKATTKTGLLQKTFVLTKRSSLTQKVEKAAQPLLHKIARQKLPPTRKPSLMELARPKQSTTKSAFQEAKQAHLSRSGQIVAHLAAHIPHLRIDEEENTRKRQNKHTYKAHGSRGKPALEKPRLGVFALYYMLTKIGVLSDSSTFHETQQNIRANEAEMQKTHEERLAELKKVLQDEKIAERWSLSNRFFSWMGTTTAMLTGIGLIASGAGIVAGTMLLIGGLLQLTSQLFDTLGVWRKIASSLPGDDPVRKKAVVQWMQIGILVISMILSGAGIVFGGFSQVSGAMSTSQMLMNSAIMLGLGTSTLGRGHAQHIFRSRIAAMRKHMTKLAELKHRREDLKLKVENSVERMEQMFEDVSLALRMESDLFRLNQRLLQG